MKPGRKSTYDMLAPMIPGQSLPPPEDLEPDQQLEWEAITARLPADWFSGENIPMLKELCRHITYARELAVEIAEVKAMLSEVVAGIAAEAEKSNVMAAGRKELCGLLRAHGYQSERIGNLSTKLRLTKLSRYGDAKTAARAARDAGGTWPKPWADWGENVSDRQ
jgi:hypothetical protein